MSKLKVGIVSANWGAMAHLPAWRAIPGVEVVAICTSRRETAQAAAKRFHIERPFWDAQAMVADPSIDIIDCGTRPSVRYPMVLAALRNHKHVYNAIPFAADLDSARTLHEAWKSSGTVAVVDAFSQWLPAHRLAKQMIGDGYLGELFAGTCMFNISLFNKPDVRFPYNWFWQTGLGVSALRNLGSHALHMLVHLFGEVDELVAHDGQLLREWRFDNGEVIHPQTNDFANALLRFKNGLVMQLQVSWNATLAAGWTVDAFGSKGRLAANAPTFPTALDTTLRAGTLGSGALDPVELPPGLLASPDLSIDATVPMPPAYPMALAMQAMVRQIEGSGTAAPDFEQAWYVERVQEALRRSANERRWVRLAEVT